MTSLATGILIVLEGIDGSGKSTLAQQLYTSLQTEISPILLTKEPGGTQLGQTIRTLVQEQKGACTPIAEFLLFAADRAQHITEIIKPALARNSLIISDRFADSSCAYQGYGRGLDHAMIKAVNTWALQGIVPQLTIYVHVPVPVAAERINARRKKSSFEQEDISFLERVAHGFDTLYKNHPAVLIVDGTQNRETVARTTHAKVMEWISSHNYLQ
jgi:dTMP kinase